MQATEKISITMPADTLRALREAVDAGEYASISEAMRDAVRIWQKQRAEHAERLNVIRARIRRSLDDPRPSLSIEEVDAHMEALFARERKARGDLRS